MATNLPSDKRYMNALPPTVANTTQPIGVQINQQGNPGPQGFPVQQGYGQPLNNYQNPTIITVQTAPRPAYSPIKFEKTPMTLVCPFCGVSMTTNIKEECNWSACGFCWISGFCIFACVQCCMGKSVGCTDVKHFCTNPLCGRMIGGYKAI